jgi:ribonucleotide reductase beta subunit family protein with ferritin-like domain
MLHFAYRRKDRLKSPLPTYSFDPKREPILNGEEERYELFPITYSDAWKQYKDQEESAWRADKIQYSTDHSDFITLPKNVQVMLTKTLAFFANADNLVLESLSKDLVDQIKVPEIKFMLAYAGVMELVHIETYNQTIQTLVTDPQERLALFSAVRHDPIIQPKFHWAQQFCNGDIPFSVRVIMMLFTEGILFSSSFLNIVMVRYIHNKCHGLIEGNEYIMHDEGKHCVNWILVYKELVQKLPIPLVHAICEDFVEFECEFAGKLLNTNDPIPQLPYDHVCEYIRCVANTLLDAIGVPILYPNATNRFDFMKSIGLIGKFNFFERKNTNYAMLGDESKNDTVIYTKLGFGLIED